MFKNIRKEINIFFTRDMFKNIRDVNIFLTRERFKNIRYIFLTREMLRKILRTS